MTSQQTTFEQYVVSFLRGLEGGNKSTLTLTAYKTDLMQFFHWLAENDVGITTPETRLGEGISMSILRLGDEAESPEREN